MREKSIKNIRKEFKENGVFYTPTELALKLKSYIDITPKAVYDPTCGAGNLLKVFPEEIQKYGQEIYEDQLKQIDISNFTGKCGDTLKQDMFKEMKFDAIVANPPFSVRWNPEELKDDPRFSEAPAMPPRSKADWAFMLHIIYHLSEKGTAAVLEFPGILYRGQSEGKIRRWFVEQNYIDRVVEVPGNTFEDTSICTCIIVLKRQRDTTDIIFERNNKQVIVERGEVESNDFTLSPNMYIPDDAPKETIDIDSTNKNVVRNCLKNVKTTMRSLLELQKQFGENFYTKELRDGLEETVKMYDRACTESEK